MKAFVKSSKSTHYYQIDQRKPSSNNSRSPTPKSRQTPVQQQQRGPRRRDEVRVFVRVKPLEAGERSRVKVLQGRQVVVSSDDDLVRSFEFHRVLECTE